MMLRQGFRRRSRIERLHRPPARRVTWVEPTRGPLTGPPAAMLAIGAAATVAAGVLIGPALIVVAGLAVLAGHHWWRRRIRTVAARRRSEQLPEALARMAGALRTGSSLTHALGEAGNGTDAPLGPELSQLARSAEQGEPLLAVLDQWADSHADTGTRLAATALALASVVGTTPARAIDGVAATLRERLAQTGERRSQATQARYSAVVLSAAPLVFTGLLVATNTAAADFLLRTPAGWACVLIGMSLDALGAVWMLRLIRAGEQI
jgi:tight adherence protein B